MKIGEKVVELLNEQDQSFKTTTMRCSLFCTALVSICGNGLSNTILQVLSDSGKKKSVTSNNNETACVVFDISQLYDYHSAFIQSMLEFDRFCEQVIEKSSINEITERLKEFDVIKDNVQKSISFLSSLTAPEFMKLRSKILYQNLIPSFATPYINEQFKQHPQFANIPSSFCGKNKSSDQPFGGGFGASPFGVGGQQPMYGGFNPYPMYGGFGYIPIFESVDPCIQQMYGVMYTDNHYLLGISNYALQLMLENNEAVEEIRIQQNKLDATSYRVTLNVIL